MLCFTTYFPTSFPSSQHPPPKENINLKPKRKLRERKKGNKKPKFSHVRHIVNCLKLWNEKSHAGSNFFHFHHSLRYICVCVYIHIYILFFFYYHLSVLSNQTEGKLLVRNIKNLTGGNRETVNKDRNPSKYRLLTTQSTMRRTWSFGIELIMKFPILMYHITIFNLTNKYKNNAVNTQSPS